MELPEYKAPSLSKAAISMMQRGWSYVVKAGTIILVCNFVVQVLQSFTWGFEFLDYNSVIEEAYVYIDQLKALGTPLEGEALQAYWNGVNAEVAALAEQSMLASIATPFAYIVAPVIGVVAWQLAAAVVTGFIAKENVVGTLAVCFSITNFINVDELVLEGGASEVATTMGLTASAALAYLMFNLYTPPCFAALGAMSAEMKSKKWFWGGIALQLGTGFTVGFLVYQIGTLITTGSVGAGFLGGLIAVVVFVVTIVGIVIKNNRKIETVGTIKETVKK